MKDTKRKAVSSTIFAVGVILAIVVAGVAGYYGGGAGASSTSKTITSTQTVGAGQTVTVVSTSTVVSATTGQAAFDLGYLINQCKSEGSSLTVYNVWDSSAYPTVLKYLAQTYPWLTANLVSFAPGDLVNKENAEFHAGHVTADVYQNSYGDWVENNASGEFQAFYDPQPFYLNSSATGAYGGRSNGGFYAYETSYDPLLIVYNTKLVAANHIPKNISSLADPYFKGKLVFDNPALLNVAGALFASYEPSMGNASWTALMKSIAANSPILTSDAGQSASDVVSGQAVIGVALMDDYAYNLGNGAPIAAIPSNPIYVLNTPMSLNKGAPHPACGQLFMDWKNSYQGQVALQLTARPSYITWIAASFYKTVSLPTNVQFLPQATGAPSYFTDSHGWVTYYSSIFGAP